MTSTPQQGETRTAAEGAARRWSFGPAVLDENSLELRVHGAPSELERKSLEVLMCLLHHAGEVVTKDELLEAVWPGRILSETVLTKCISRIREAIADQEQTLIKTVHGYGYRLVAEVKVEAAASAPAPPRFDFKPGDHPPLRPLWSLVEPLGTGGHGEAWLARHDKTHEERVYKFALDSNALTSLKREITLYRVLNDMLGERAAIVRVLEWNLEEAPYFIEVEHVSGGSLVTWAEKRGGVSQVPLAIRLDIAAQIAEALAAAHSVGVLHKDLKPSNVLIQVEEGQPPRIKLGDWGSGGVLDAERLKALGITRLGFTKTISVLDRTSGTPFYLAPEVLAGQPHTVQADIYALGIMLYQLVVGDLKRALATGWERDVLDELLREDITQTTQGRPGARLADAAALAQRLRTLDARRQQRAAVLAAQRQAEEAKTKAEQVRKAVRELRRLRIVAAALSLLTAVAVAAGLVAYRERNAAQTAAIAAQTAAATTQAVSDFLNKDLLSAGSPFARSTKSVTVEDLLDRAAGNVERGLADQPEAAAKVHYSLGASYTGLGLADKARRELTLAVSQYEQLHGRGADPTLLALRQLAYPSNTSPAEGLAILREILSYWEPRYGPADPKVMQTRRKVGYALFSLGRYPESIPETRKVLEHCTGVNLVDEGMPICPFGQYVLGEDQIALGEFKQGETTLRQCISDHAKMLGERHGILSFCHVGLALALIESGRYNEAEEEVHATVSILGGWGKIPYPASSWQPYYTARIRLEQQRAKEALTILEQAPPPRFNGDNGAWTATMSPYLMGQAYQQLGNAEKAAGFIKQSLTAFELNPGRGHPVAIQMRAGLADVLREQGKMQEAWAVLNDYSKEALAALPPRHPILADLRREQGLLWLKQGKLDQARTALAEALDIDQFRYGPTHWRTERDRKELARVRG